MKNKLTLLVEEKNTRFAKKYATEINTSASFLLNRFLKDLQQKTTRKKILQKDGWVEKYAGIFNTGKKDLLQNFIVKK